MENNNNHQQNGNGFLLGVIVGVLITLLFTTKRGRIILKEILEKGVQKFSNLEELMKESTMLDDEEDFDEEENDFIPSEPIAVNDPPEEKPEPKTTKESSEPKPTGEKTSPHPAPPAKEEKMQQHEAASKPHTSVQEKNTTQEKLPEKPKSTKRWFRGLHKKN